MKKFLLGLTVGVMISTAGTAFAASGLIGKKVQSEVQIKLDGKNVSNGVIIDGSTYAPVRSITESVGLDVGYSKGVVTLTSETRSDLTVPEIEQTPGPDTSDPYWQYDTKEKIESRIKSVEEGIAKNEDLISEEQRIIGVKKESYDKYPDNYQEVPEEIETRLARIVTYQSNIDSLESELKGLKAKLAAME